MTEQQWVPTTASCSDPQNRWHIHYVTNVLKTPPPLSPITPIIIDQPPGSDTEDDEAPMVPSAYDKERARAALYYWRKKHGHKMEYKALEAQFIDDPCGLLRIVRKRFWGVPADQPTLSLTLPASPQTEPTGSTSC